jgi:DNA polymerase-3 subunit epsilon
MYAVIDLETTGLWPRSDRVVEIAVLRLDPGLAVTETWTTLVNPERDVGPTRLHGITAGDVADAPPFLDLADALAERLSGAVLVAHNLPFDARFLRAEFDRVGVDFPEVRGLCTLALAQHLPAPGGRALQACCEQLGLGVSADHSALADAQAAAELLRYCLARALPLPPHKPIAVPVRASPRATCLHPRGSACPRDRESPLRTLLSRLPARAAAPDAGDEAVAAYADLLDRALEDRRVTAEECSDLEEAARSFGLTREATGDIHRSYLTGLVGAALADDLLTDAERKDIERVASLLGLAEALPDLLDAGTTPAMKAARPKSRTHELAGKSVCFTGESVCSLQGNPLDRPRQELLAAEAGLVVAPRVTKRLDVLVLADPDSVSGKARKAREYGTRLIAERSFWTMLGVAVD